MKSMRYWMCTISTAMLWMHIILRWTWEALKRWPSSGYLREILVEHIITINSFIISPFKEPFPTFWTKATPPCFIGELFVFMVHPQTSTHKQTNNNQQSTINNMNVKVELVELSFWSVSGFERTYILYYIVIVLFPEDSLYYIMCQNNNCHGIYKLHDIGTCWELWKPSEAMQRFSSRQIPTLGLERRQD